MGEVARLVPRCRNGKEIDLHRDYQTNNEATAHGEHIDGDLDEDLPREKLVSVMSYPLARPPESSKKNGLPISICEWWSFEIL